MLLRYSILNTISAFILAYLAYFHSGVHLLWELDPTRITFLILGIYAGVTAYLGLYREATNFKMVRFIASSLTGIGLIGTVLGIMHLLSTIGSMDLTDVKAISVYLFAGAAPVFLTTLFGISGFILLQYQMAFVFGVTYEDE